MNNFGRLCTQFCLMYTSLLYISQEFNHEFNHLRYTLHLPSPVSLLCQAICKGLHLRYRCVRAVTEIVLVLMQKLLHNYIMFDHQLVRPAKLPCQTCTDYIPKHDNRPQTWNVDACCENKALVHIIISLVPNPHSYNSYPLQHIVSVCGAWYQFVVSIVSAQTLPPKVTSYNAYNSAQTHVSAYYTRSLNCTDTRNIANSPAEPTQHNTTSTHKLHLKQHCIYTTNLN